MLSIIKHGICQIFYTRKIPKFLILPGKKIFGKKLRMEDVLSVLLYPNTNYLHLLLSEPKKFTRVLFVTFVTNSTSGANNTIDNNILVV